MRIKPLSGEPCLRHGCSLCCYGTEMLLTRPDINRIVKLGYRLSDFAVRSLQGWRLRNINGKCFFLEENKCKIYRFRPYGCRLYPLIYDQNSREIRLDDLCPHKMELNVRKENIDSLLLILRHINCSAEIIF
ncbi:MAG: YkgJ family cysteine cluster protein [Candidatus Bathyarchaeia archaeon]|nr:YkgJ family cysteine cluster protein [Candidatus Bathyarchaeota archaeon]